MPDRHDHDHDHGHQHDKGLRGILRYLRFAPRMWRSEVNDAVIDLAGPATGERGLDIGAGMGPGVVLAARRGARVTAVEPTPFMRTILRVRRLAHRSRDRIDVVDGAAEELPLPDGSVDVAWATNTMHHWTDPDRAVGEIRRVLAPRGRLVLVDEDFADPAHPDVERFGARHRNHEEVGFDRVDASEMARRLTEAGLVDVDTSRTRLAGVPVITVTGCAPSEPGDR